MPPTRTRTTLYRFFDASDRLLYVGISDHAFTRFRSHARVQPWWGDVVRSTMEHHSTRPEALYAEEVAIKTEMPAHNVVHAVTTPAGPESLNGEGLRWHKNGWEIRVTISGKHAYRRVKAPHNKAGQAKALAVRDEMLMDANVCMWCGNTCPNH